MIRYISDLHLDGRGPFREEHPGYASLEAWHCDVVDAWNGTVSKTDTVWVLGDVCLKATPAVCEVLRSLNGDLKLIRGNHDRVEKFSIYVERFSEVSDLKQISDCNVLVVMCHYPIESWNQKIRGAVHLHGHVHGNTWDANAFLPNRYNVWGTALGMRPQPLTFFMEQFGYKPDYYRQRSDMIESRLSGQVERFVSEIVNGPVSLYDKVARVSER